jgi:hypothetical protein
MSLQLQMEQMPGYLAARFTGQGAADEIWRQFELIVEHCKRAECDKLLIDVTRLEGKSSVIEKYFAANESLIFARYGIQVACVEKPERIDPRKFFVLVAQNRWVSIDVFTDFQSAEEWLLK